MRSTTRMYFFADGERRKGPFSLDEIREFPLKADTWVWREGLPAWTELVNVPELWAVFAERLVEPPAAAQQYQLPEETEAATPKPPPLAWAAIILGAVAFPAWAMPWSIFFVAPLALAAMIVGLIAHRRAKRENAASFMTMIGAGLGAVNLMIVVAILGMIVFVALTTQSRKDAEKETAPATAPSMPR